MCNKFRKIENCYKMLEMIHNNSNNALYSIHCGNSEMYIDDALSDEITKLVKKHYGNKIYSLNEELK